MNNKRGSIPKEGLVMSTLKDYMEGGSLYVKDEDNLKLRSSDKNHIKSDKIPLKQFF